MAQVSFDADLRALITSVSMQLVHESQVVLRSPWTGDRQVLNRGYPHWAGTVDFGGQPVEGALWRRLEAFFASLDGAGNFFELPHYRPLMALETRVQGTRMARERIETLTRSNVSALPGQAVRAGNRLFRIRTVGQRLLVLDPQVPLPPDTILRAANSTSGAASTVRAAAAEPAGPLMRRLKSTAGPWTLAWREAL